MYLPVNFIQSLLIVFFFFLTGRKNQVANRNKVVMEENHILWLKLQIVLCGTYLCQFGFQSWISEEVVNPQRDHHIFVFFSSYKSNTNVFTL